MQVLLACCYIYHLWKIHNGQHIYPTELEIKDTTDKARYASFLDLHLDIDSDGRLKPNLLDKRDDFYFPIVNFP
jgi:hypothetical protein